MIHCSPLVCGERYAVLQGIALPCRVDANAKGSNVIQGDCSDFMCAGSVINFIGGMNAQQEEKAEADYVSL